MIKKPHENQPSPSLASANRIIINTTIKGDISCESDFRLDGILEGDIIVKGKFVMGREAKVTGNITCANADISGKVIGNINSQSLSLRSNAYIKGEVSTGKLIVEQDVYFDAVCKMLQNEKDRGQS